MQRKFVLNLIFIIAVNLLIKPLYIFGIEINVQNTLGSENYGIYYALFNLSYILSFILDPGITNYNNRHIAQNRQLLDKSFSNIIAVKLLLSIVYVFIVLLYGILTQVSRLEWSLLICLLLSQIFNSYILYSRSNLAGLHLFKTDTFLSILDKLILIILAAPLLFYSDLQGYFNLQTFVFIQLVSYASTALISFFIVKSYTKSFNFRFDLKMTRIIIKESFPYALLTLLMLVYTKIDTVILRELHVNGNFEVGTYAAAYRIIDAMNMIAVLFAGILYPIYSKSIKDRLNVYPITKTSFSILVLPALVVSTIGIIYSYEIMQLLYKENYEYSSVLFQLLLVSFIFICNSYIFGTLLTAKGAIKSLNKIALSAVVLNIVFNLIFVKSYGAKASCYIAAATFAYVSILQTALAFKHLSFSPRFGSILRMLVYILVVIAINYLLHKSFLYWYISIIFGGILSILVLFVLRLVSVKQIIKLIKNN